MGVPVTQPHQNHAHQTHTVTRVFPLTLLASSSHAARHPRPRLHLRGGHQLRGAVLYQASPDIWEASDHRAQGGHDLPGEQAHALHADVPPADALSEGELLSPEDDGLCGVSYLSPDLYYPENKSRVSEERAEDCE